MGNVWFELIKRWKSHHTETSQLICKANQLTGFYMIATLAFNELIHQFNLVIVLAIVAMLSLNSLNIRIEIWWRFLVIILLLLLFPFASLNKSYVKLMPEPVNPHFIYGAMV